MSGNGSAPKCTFALFFGNRGFFPASLQAAARKEVDACVQAQGHKTLLLDAGLTKHGAVETPQEGEIYARFLEEHRGQFDGVILSLPNFGDETGAVRALKNANVPILIQAYPDDLDRMAPAQRRDAFCGKFSIMDVFNQYGLPFTALQPHTVAPSSTRFTENLDYFARLCNVVKSMRTATVGAIGARTTAFKTVRIDELTLQRYGVTMETIDLSLILDRVHKLDRECEGMRKKGEFLRDYSNWDKVPEKAFENICRLGVVYDEIIDEMELDLIAVRCWIELQQQLGISPCVLLSELNNRGVVAACEVDVGSGLTMHALRAASDKVATCLDWNNNFGDDENKCILFHCGPVPQDMMAAKGNVVDHSILANALGQGCSYGCNVGRIAPMPITYGNLLTEDGKMRFYLGEGRFTEDVIPEEFFGCAGVAEFANLQNTLQTIGYQGHRHHVAVTPGHHIHPVKEAFEKYLGYEVTAL